MNPRTHNFGAYLTAVNADPAITILSSADGSESDGLDIDRLALTRDVYRSAKVVIPFTTTLSTGNLCTVAANVQTGLTTTSYADFGSTGVTVTVTNSTGAVDQVLSHVLEFDVDLGAADRFVRTQITVTMDEAAADICNIGASWVFGGPPVLPASTEPFGRGGITII
jgi:hypothetical protein